MLFVATVIYLTILFLDESIIDVIVILGIAVEPFYTNIDHCQTMKNF